ncbi:MAG: hypothetical protein LBV55_04415 [Acholeplasmatales bacterium]|nr:hypothetical protein [Acholeplasmatales bacterium]
MICLICKRPTRKLNNFWELFKEDKDYICEHCFASNYIYYDVALIPLSKGRVILVFDFYVFEEVRVLDDLLHQIIAHVSGVPKLGIIINKYSPYLSDQELESLDYSDYNFILLEIKRLKEDEI